MTTAVVVEQNSPMLPATMKVTRAPLVSRSAALCGLVAIVVLLLFGHSTNGVAPAVAAPFGVAAGWAGLQLTYATRYAHLYYATPEGGIDFNSEAAPAYSASSTSATTSA